MRAEAGVGVIDDSADADADDDAADLLLLSSGTQRRHRALIFAQTRDALSLVARTLTRHMTRCKALLLDGR